MTLTRILKVISFIFIGLAPILFWLEIYRARTTEYDENWAHFFGAIFIALANGVILVLARKEVFRKSNFNKFIGVVSVLFATPITVGLIIFYLLHLQMSFISSGSSYDPVDKQSFADEKRRNFFKAENLLIRDYLGESPDTLKAVIKRSGKVETIVKLENGEEKSLSSEELQSLTQSQKNVLLTY